MKKRVNTLFEGGPHAGDRPVLLVRRYDETADEDVLEPPDEIVFREFDPEHDKPGHQETVVHRYERVPVVPAPPAPAPPDSPAPAAPAEWKYVYRGEEQ